MTSNKHRLNCQKHTEWTGEHLSPVCTCNQDSEYFKSNSEEIIEALNSEVQYWKGLAESRNNEIEELQNKLDKFYRRQTRRHITYKSQRDEARRQLKSAREVIEEMKIYLDHGCGTSINSNSGFHRQLRNWLEENKED